ncbi:uncharacterized protein GGS22DRAFT_159836 [Annulohypoxylon maeteangense]|uniref:uncharacterized protein n=1 Tax=Annulohypoxylon maeteangense TaxID=1927788 RepID=UPI002008337B|nr:uncharacterized protein GGS22DRAFT_159836 [Annulohypoxylon maeteangense]KAI0886079.1 hypothetical protein GGS22DRAFT_159836 [Annulohypoxylon maeteangense]
MRPPRIAILVLFFAACLFLLCRAMTSSSRPASVISSPRSAQRLGFRSFFSFSTPFTLFPPNAVITIADDNSTSFAARPAAFGSPLPSKGLNGQLWIGSGFTEESTQDGEGEGELGCSDVPGWDDGTSNAVLKPSKKESQQKFKSVIAVGKSKNQKRTDSRGPLVDRTSPTDLEPKSKTKPVNDGTDDYLHQNFDPPTKSQIDVLGSSSSNHADIQSIQEGAEIAGKIVLLSRGGCGFLEKVKWAQRRGAIALIVGDNQRGGPLIQMYAHGDTSNVTIPSIFTSRTTAYLLSLMMQPGSFIEDIIDESGKPSLKVQQSDKARKNRKARNAAVPAQPLKFPSKSNNKSPVPNKHPSSSAEPSDSSLSWLPKIFSWGSTSSSSSATSGSRPPSSGQLDWVLVEDFSDEKDRAIKNSLERAAKARVNGASRLKTKKIPEDNFQIGVEDWRDPDLLGSSDQNDGLQEPLDGNEKFSWPNARSDQISDVGTPENKRRNTKGGRVTPNSGEYAAGHMPTKGSNAIGSNKGNMPASSNGGLISKIFGDDEVDFTKVEAQPKPIDVTNGGKPVSGLGVPSPFDGREGLWVVITPSSGASPFFDTLLVLVISPLITLTVVYALLILRARIRRRRWRAPKSVVERLPVRTYHTVASTPSRTSRVPSPTSSSPTTPLLQSQHGPSRSRPRSRTITGVPSAGDLLQIESSLSLHRSSSRAEHEKRSTHPSSEWKKYMGRQVECVVCLEEYVDGVSQVMSLPCGHEFHVDCITPWLITRRRTCPICKGDVVRSLARGVSSSPRYEPYQDDSDDDLEVQATSSSSPDAPLEQADDQDVEQGIPVSPHHSHQEAWFGALRNTLRAGFQSRSRQTSGEPENQDRQ